MDFFEIYMIHDFFKLQIELAKGGYVSVLTRVIVHPTPKDLKNGKYMVSAH